MAQYKIDNKNIKVSGESIGAFIDGLGIHRQTGLDILEKYGIGHPEPGHWYPLQDNLDAFRELEQKLGHAALFLIGQKVMESAIAPTEVNTIEKGLASIDVAFHMNHSLKGKPMIDPVTGTKSPGIGNYNFKLLTEGEAEIVCDNPYPTSFDEGLIFAMAQRFNSTSVVQVIEERSSRSRGGEHDVFFIQWF